MSARDTKGVRVSARGVPSRGARLRRASACGSVLASVGLVLLTGAAYGAPSPAPGAGTDEPDVQSPSTAKAEDGGWLDGEDGSAKNAAPAAAPAAAPSTEAQEPAEPEVKAAPASAAAAPKLAAAPRYVIPPPTEPASEPPPEDYETVPFTYHQLHWDIAAAARVSLLRDGGYDLFSEDDVLTQVSLTAGRAFYSVDRFSVAVSGLFEMGGSEATTRGMQAEYANQRFGLSLEGRYHVRHWLYGYVRVAPSAMHGEATLTPSSGASYENDSWGASVDGALGLALRPFGSSDGRKSGARFFVFAEGGYGVAQEQELSLTPSGNVTPDRAQPLELGVLDTSGVLMRFGAMLTF